MDMIYHYIGEVELFILRYISITVNGLHYLPVTG